MAHSFLHIFSLSDRPLHILDVGAAFNEGAAYRHLVEKGYAHVWAIDANPHTLEKIHPSHRAAYTLLPHIIGNDGNATIHFTALPQLSSIYKPNPEVLRRFVGLSGANGDLKGFKILKEERVETARLDDACEADIDFIKLDIQGAEFGALRSAPRLLTSALLVESEVEFVPLYQNQPLFHDVAGFMADQGFVLHKLLDIQGRPFHGTQYDTVALITYSQVLWADAVFIKQDLITKSENYSDADLLRACAILHDIYSSYDLVRMLLAVIDRRLGTKKLQQYTDWVKTLVLKRRYFNVIDRMSDLAEYASNTGRQFDR